MEKTKHTYVIKGDEKEWIQGAIIAPDKRSIDIYWKHSDPSISDSIKFCATGNEREITSINLDSHLRLIFEMECLPGSEVEEEEEEIHFFLRDFPKEHVSL